ncbi:zinc finger protein pita-like [Drosophila montana]|uniref:zinc finger protein pita-like n=1 Tax=Drosophila montana TaxID=40370 RepID=UPI00313DD6D7
MEICRACMSDSVTLVDIFCDRPLPDYEYSLAEMLNELVDFKVKRDDKLPQKICVSCGLNAQIAFRFRRRFEQSHRLLCMKAMEDENVFVHVLEADPNAGQLKQKLQPSMPAINEKSNSKLGSARKLRKGRLQSTEELITSISSRSVSREKDGNVIVVIPDIDSFNGMDQADRSCTIVDNADACKPHRYPLRHRICSQNAPKSVEIPLLPRPMRSRMRQFKCDSCHLSFASIENLSKHKLQHEGKRNFKCLNCMKAYRKKSKLLRHIQTHIKEHPNMCPQCSRTFGCRSKLRRHLYSHSEERPFICPHCQSAFKNPWNLRRHVLNHSKKKTYKCSACKKSFANKWNLKLHSCLPQSCLRK